MNKELFFIGAPVEFKKGVLIYPPTVKEIITNKHFNAYRQVLTFSQEEIEDIFTKEKIDFHQILTPIEFLLNNCYNDKNYEIFCQQAFQFFLHQQVDFLYDKKAIVVGSLEKVLSGLTSIDQLIIITEEEFFDFQNLIRLASGQKAIEKPIQDEDPRIKAIKAKARYRDRLKAKQNLKNGLSLFNTMASICCMGIGLTPLNIGEMSYVAMNAILDQYQAKEKYQIDIESLLAGADSKKIKPQYWIRNLED